MNIYLMRHAHAVEADEWNGPDATRPLTAKGRKAADGAARGLARLPDPITRIISSPYTRARETAAIVGERLGVAVTLDTRLTEARTPLNQLFAALDEAGYAPNLLFVGHQPMLGQILAQLAGNCDGEVDMKKAAVACVALSDPPANLDPVIPVPFIRLVDGAQLLWLRTWRELSALADSGDEQA